MGIFSYANCFNGFQSYIISCVFMHIIQIIDWIESAVSFFVYECCIFGAKYDTTDSCESDKLSYKPISCDETFNMIVHIYQITNTASTFHAASYQFTVAISSFISFYVQSCIHVIMCMCVFVLVCMYATVK